MPNDQEIKAEGRESKYSTTTPILLPSTIDAARQSELGWSVSEDKDSQPMSRVFNIQPDDIDLGVPEFECRCYQVNNLEQAHELFSKRFGISATVHHAIFDGGSASNQNINSTTTQARKNLTVIYAVYSRKGKLNKEADRLILGEGVTTRSLQSGYVNAGRFVCGYKIVIEGELRTAVQTSDSEIAGGIHLLGPMLNAEFERIHGKKDQRNNDAINVVVQGIGGFVIPPELTIRGKFFDEDIQRLNKHFAEKCPYLLGAFCFGREGILTFPKGFSIPGSKCSYLIKIIGEIRDKLSLAVNPDLVELQKFKKKLDDLKESLDHYETNFTPDEELKKVANMLSQLIREMLAANIVLENTFCRIKVKIEKEFFYLPSSVRDYNQAGQNTFKLAHCDKSPVDGKKAFYLINDMGMYLVDSFPVTYSDNKTKAAPFCLEATPDKQKYHLILKDKALQEPYSKYSSIYFIFTAFGEPKKAIISIESDAFKQMLLSKLDELERLFPTGLLPYMDVPVSASPHQPEEKPLVDETSVVRFVYDVFPNLRPAQDQSLVWIMGKVAAGKSAFTNYLRGFEFNYDEVDELTVKDPQKPFAKMSPTDAAVTLFPTVYEGEPYAYLDNPGLGAGKKREDDLNAFSMFVAKEMSAQQKAIVIVITISDLLDSRTAFRELMNQLRTIIHEENLGDVKRNIIFIFNLKTRVMTKDVIFKRFEKRKEEWNKQLGPYKKVLEEERSKLPPEAKEIVKEGWWEGIQKFIKTKTDQAKVLLARLAQLGHSITQEEVDSYLEALRIAELIHKDNTFVWGDPNDPTCRNQFLKYLRNMEGSVHKEYMQFSSNNDVIEKFKTALDDWVYLNFTSPLEDMIARVKNLREQILVCDAHITASVYEDATAKEAKSIVGKRMEQNIRERESLEEEKEDLEKKYLFQDLELEEYSAGIGDFFTFNWWVDTKAKPYSAESGVFTEIRYVDKKEVKRISEEKTSAGVEEISSQGRKVKVPKYKGYNIVYKSDNFMGSIPKGFKVGEVWGLTKDHKRYKVRYGQILGEIQALNEKIKENEKEIATISENDENQRAQRKKEALAEKARYEDVQRTVQEEMNGKSKYFQQAYAKLKPIQEVWTRVNKNSPFPMLTRFLSLYHSVYEQRNLLGLNRNFFKFNVAQVDPSLQIPKMITSVHFAAGFEGNDWLHNKERPGVGGSIKPSEYKNDAQKQDADFAREKWKMSLIDGHWVLTDDQLKEIMQLPETRKGYKYKFVINGGDYWYPEGEDRRFILEKGLAITLLDEPVSVAVKADVVSSRGVHASTVSPQRSVERQTHAPSASTSALAPETVARGITMSSHREIKQDVASPNVEEEMLAFPSSSSAPSRVAPASVAPFLRPAGSVQLPPVPTLDSQPQNTFK